MKIVHIINPIKIAKNHELYTAQPITFASLLNARENVKNSTHEVILVSTQYPEDKELIPNYILQLSDLNRSVNDCNSSLTERKLPLIHDILQKSKEVSDTDYIIYTNVDIGLMPFFYDFVFNEISKGHDAIIINKRRLFSNFKSVAQLPEIYAQIGRSHPGFDCFVFKTTLLDKFILDDICVGVPFSGVSLLHNLVAFATNPKVIVNSHLTFHIGMNVLGSPKNDYYNHNRTVFFKKIQPKIKDKYDLKKFPYAQESFLKKSAKWVLNPSIFTTNYLNLMGKSSLQKIKLRMDELRWEILQR